jgi:two-component system, OmpR family, phosphate regulon response regulator PhoB
LKASILLVEDDLNLLEMVRYNLESEGFSVATATDGEEALLCLKESVPDLVLLDWMLPNVSGIEICRQIRQGPETMNLPVIMITARTEEDDQVRGLDTGADDYITKPFSPRELIARIKAVLRRIRPEITAEVLTYADIVMNTAEFRVSRGERRIKLGPTEFKLLRHFMEHPTRVYSREQLLDSVWGHDIYIEARTVDVHIRRLRRALCEDGEEDVIRTVRAAGYALDSAKS